MRRTVLVLMVAAAVGLAACSSKPEAAADAAAQRRHRGGRRRAPVPMPSAGGAAAREERTRHRRPAGGHACEADHLLRLRQQRDQGRRHRRSSPRMRSYLAANATVRVRLEGNTDERGSREYNIGLGERRAQAVRRALLLQGATEAQLSTVSYGAERPAVPGSNEAAWAQNRRVEIVYLQIGASACHAEIERRIDRGRALPDARWPRSARGSGAGRLNDLDARLTKLERVHAEPEPARAGAAPGCAAGRSPHAARADRGAGEQHRSHAQAAARSVRGSGRADGRRRRGAGAAAPARRAGQPPSGAGSAEQAAYVQAFDVLKSGNYAAPIAGFKQFLATYPQSALADNAQYWLGEAYYVTRDFDNAARRVPRGRRALAGFAQGARCAAEARATRSSSSENTAGARDADAGDAALSRHRCGAACAATPAEHCRPMRQ